MPLRVSFRLMKNITICGVDVVQFWESGTSCWTGAFFEDFEIDHSKQDTSPFYILKIDHPYPHIFDAQLKKIKFCAEHSDGTFFSFQQIRILRITATRQNTSESSCDLCTCVFIYLFFLPSFFLCLPDLPSWDDNFQIFIRSPSFKSALALCSQNIYSLLK
jgi:hypothetical protein